MTNKIENLRDLFIEQGRELYDASRIEQKEIPGIQKSAMNPKLKKVLDRKLNVAKQQSSRLEKAFKKIEVTPEGEKNEYCQAILKSSKNLMERTGDESVRDAVIVNSMQRLNHNNITSYGSLVTYAREIGLSDIATSLHETLDEEREIDRELSELAKSEINKKASEQ